MANPDELVERAEHLVEVGRVDEAITFLGQALAADPHHVGALCELARAHSNKDRHLEALRAVDAALAVAPEHGYAAFLRAAVLVDAKFPQALAAAEYAVRLRPEFWPAHGVLARALNLAGRRREALDVARHTVSLAPAEPGAHRVLADVAEDAGDKKLAEAEYREALRLDPSDSIARIGLAGLDIRRGRIRSGAGHLLDAAPLDSRAAELAGGLRHLVSAGLMICLIGVAVSAVVAIIALIVGAVNETAGLTWARMVCAVMAVVMALALGYVTTRVPKAAWPLVRSMMRTNASRRLAIIGGLLAVGLLTAYAATGQRLVLFLLVIVGIPVALTLDLVPDPDPEDEHRPKTANDILY
jgi:tetratricopeptide (TPR) repeat protein